MMEDRSCALSEFVCSVGSGALFAVGWWWFIDGLIVANQHDGTTYAFQMWLPGIFATLGLIGVNITNPSDLREDGLGDDPDAQKAKIFFFFSWLFLFGGLVSAVWICIQDFANQSSENGDTTTYPGIAIILQAVVITLSSVLMWIGRGAKSDGF